MDCAKELAEAKATIRSLSNTIHRSKEALLKAKIDILYLETKITEIQEARTLTAGIPESWGWSDCFFCSEPIKDNANYDTFMSKSIHKECREKLIDGLNANQREKEKGKDE